MSGLSFCCGYSQTKTHFEMRFIVNILNCKPHYVIMEPHPRESISLFQNYCAIQCIIHVHSSCSHFVLPWEFLNRLLHCILIMSSLPRCILRNIWAMKRKPNVSLGWETEDIVNQLKGVLFLESRGKMDQMMVRACKFEGKSKCNLKQRDC